MTWAEPSMPNGIIRHYDITYFRSTIGISDVQQVVVISDTTAELFDLDIFTNYSIFVEAFTVSIGLRSDIATVMTNEDGKLVN